MGNPLHKELYHYYLTTDAWKRRRAQVLERDQGRCTICDGEDELQVHHLSYGNIFEERLYQLTTLCANCHAHLHDDDVRLEIGVRAVPYGVMILVRDGENVVANLRVSASRIAQLLSDAIKE
jgi:hypothetical protein